MSEHNPSAGPVPTDPAETKPGFNRIVVKTVQYGAQPMILEKDVQVPVRDGTVLYANLYRPAKEGRFPVVICADIYGRETMHLVYAAAMPGAITLGGYDVSPFGPWEAPDPGFWIPNDYVMLKVALRGTGGSEGLVEPMSWTEARDYHDAIEWAAVQPWSNGNVGMNGVSYLAMIQWRVAQLNPPHLKAMIPWEGVSDLYREWSFHGGIPETYFSRTWCKGLPPRNPESDFEDLPAMERAHPLFDAYWAGKHGNLADIRVPMYVGASFSTQGLHNRGTIEGFRQSSSEHKWLEIHGRKEWETYYSREALERQKRFFDYFLKGMENDWMDTPRVRLEVRERFYHGEVRYEDEWPLARTRYTPLYLDGASGALSPSVVEGSAAATYSSTETEDREAGGTTFVIRFEEDTELTGYMKLKLWVSTDGAEDMDLFVGVHKLDRRGAEIHLPDFNHIENGRVASGWLRVSHRELDEQRSTPYQPWLLHARLLTIEPGEIVPVEIEILPSSTLFRAGESLKLQVRGTEIPRPPTDTLPADHGAMRYAHTETVNRGNHTIHTGGEHDSHLLVPVIPEKG